MLAQGISGTIRWTIDRDGVLCFIPVNGKEGTFADSDDNVNLNIHDGGYAWNQYYQHIERIKSKGIIHLAKDSSFMFYGCSFLKNINALKNWDTQDVKDVSNMFSDCTSLTNVDGLKNWNTQNVKWTSCMFYDCNSLSNINGLKNWNTENVTFMGYMFHCCFGLTNLDGLKNWNTQKVTDMMSMFFGCSHLTNIDALKDWNTENVTDMSRMFYSCCSLTDISVLKNWNIQNVTDMVDMFYECFSLATVEFSETNKKFISELPADKIPALSLKWHKVDSTQEYTPDEIVKNWNSSFKGVWSREKISKLQRMKEKLQLSC